MTRWQPKNNLTSKQKINIELANRAGNKKSSKLLRHHTPAKELANLKIAFNCECSDPTCKQRIALTVDDYEKLHRSVARFVIVKGHEEPKIEKVKKSGNKIAVVDKYALS